MTTLEHRPYPKVATALADRPSAPRWVATEKIHGANFVIGIDADGGDVAFGKRKAWLEPDEPFFGWQMLRAELEAAARGIHEELRGELDLAGRGPVMIYGELFGGGYPHEAVDALPGLSPVQTGVWYSPALHVAVFDVLVIRDGDPWFLSFSRVQELAHAVGLLPVPLLAHVALADMPDVPLRFSTNVPVALGLPVIAGNMAEGFVVKPDVDCPAATRPVAKHRIPEFDENRFDASAPFDADAWLSLDEIRRLAARMANPVRIASARSKVGEDPGAIIAEAALDVWIDLESIFPRRLQALDDHEETALRDALLQLARDQLPG